MNAVLPVRPRVLMGLLFSPRGGSAQVARYLGRFLPGAGWDVTLVAGSLGAPGDHGHAGTFFDGLDVRAVDYTASREAPEPLLHVPPYHPSYEDRPGAPDPVFARVNDVEYERLVHYWATRLHRAGAARADVLHLHHLTPLNEAARRVAADVPVVGHLHGTELLMLREIDRGPPAEWRFAARWAERLRAWAQGCDRLLVLSPDAVTRVPTLLGVDPERVAWSPNGFDPEGFDRRTVRGTARVDFWRRWLVEDPQGWDRSGVPGSVAYDDERLTAAFGPGGPVLLYVGRFTEVKRLSLLVQAYARARPRFRTPAPLVLLGGYPGEWEGEHPLEAIERIGVPEVFLAGWRGHDVLPEALNAADALVLPSVREAFGQVLVEAMACGVPPVAIDRHGPASIVEDPATGWLVPPDDEQALADALVCAVNDPAERARRGEAAYAAARERFAWPALAERVAAVYEDARASREAAAGLAGSA